MFRILCALFIALTISGKANSQTLKLNSLDGKKIDRPANTFQAEQKYYCELSRIGKLIVKSLLKDSVIHYELAIHDKNDKRNNGQSGVSISEDSLQNTRVTRFHRQKSKILTLVFVYTVAGDSCTYYLNLLSDNGIQMIGFTLDGNGTVLSRNNNNTLTNEERISAQREVNAWVTYFE